MKNKKRTSRKKIKKKGKGFFSIKSKPKVVKLKIEPVNISDITISSQTQKREAAANEKTQKREAAMNEKTQKREAAMNERRKKREEVAIEREHRNSVKKYDIKQTRDILRNNRESQTIERQGDSLDIVITNYKRKFTLYKQHKNLTKLKELLSRCKNPPQRFTDADEFVDLADNIQRYINDLETQNAGKNKKKTFKKKKR
jgi:hypothetical protein